MAAMSEDCPRRFNGIMLVTASACWGVSLAVMSVSMKPGATQFAVTFREANSFARDLVRPIIPALAADEFAKYKINFLPAHPDVQPEASLAAVLKNAKIFPIDADYAGANRKRVVERWIAEVLNP